MTLLSCQLHLEVENPRGTLQELSNVQEIKITSYKERWQQLHPSRMLPRSSLRTCVLNCLRLRGWLGAFRYIITRERKENKTGKKRLLT